MKRFFIAASFCILANWANAESQILAEGGWVRQTPPVTDATAAYLTLHNKGKTVDLVSVETDAARVVELHQVTRKGELLQMEKIDKITLPEHATVELKPGDFHLMLIGLTAPLQTQSAVNLVLHFSNGDALPVELPVKNPLDDSPTDSHSHNHSQNHIHTHHHH